MYCFPFFFPSPSSPLPPPPIKDSKTHLPSSVIHSWQKPFWYTAFTAFCCWADLRTEGLSWYSTNGTRGTPEEQQQLSQCMQETERLLKSSQLWLSSLCIPPSAALTCPWHWCSYGVGSMFPDPELLFSKAIWFFLLIVYLFCVKG